jgi:hypothetical protein
MSSYQQAVKHLVSVYGKCLSYGADYLEMQWERSTVLCEQLLLELNMAGNVHVTYYWGAFAKPLLLWKQYHKCVCVCCACVCASARERACSLSNPACIALPYCHLRPRWLHHMFRHFLVTWSSEQVTEHKMCFDLHTTFMWCISHYKKKLKRDCHKCKKRVHVMYPLFLSDSVRWEPSCSMQTDRRK